MRYIRSRRLPCVAATTCPTAARSTAVAISVHTGDAVSKILAVWWKREAICAACRVRKSASLSRNFRSPIRESALRVLLFRGFSGMKAASLTRVEHTTARRVCCALSDRCCAVIRLAGFGDRNQFETFGPRFEAQARQLLFRVPSLELRRTSIHPGFAFGEQAVDQYCKITTHSFDRRREGWQLAAQTTIPRSQVAVALQQGGGRRAQCHGNTVFHFPLPSSNGLSSGDVLGGSQSQP